MGVQSNRINKMGHWLDESQKHYTERKEPGTKEYITYDFIYIKF